MIEQMIRMFKEDLALTRARGNVKLTETEVATMTAEFIAELDRSERSCNRECEAPNSDRMYNEDMLAGVLI